MEPFLRRIPGTDIEISALGLGTVKFGRNQGVKYPTSFQLPSDREVKNLLSLTQDSGINLIDTAPAYGSSESRIGETLTNRHEWVICTKVGEEFDAGKSSFNFSAQYTRNSIERSLQRLKTGYLDIVLIHSDGNDLSILQESDCLETLKRFQEQGYIRAIGMSTKTIEGGLLAASLMDVVMITYNLQQQDQAVLNFARQNSCGVVIKKGLMSGHVNDLASSINHKANKLGTNLDPVHKSMALILQQPGIHSMIIGTINSAHLKQNVKTAKSILNTQ